MGSIPEGFHTLTPHLFIDGAGDALAYYEKTLGAQTAMRMDMPGTNKVMHAMMQVGTSRIFIADPNPEWGQEGASGQSAISFYVYVDDADAAFKQAVNGGMASKSEPEDMFWGDRTGVAVDRYGISWTFATHVRDVPMEEMAEAMKAMAG